MSLVQRKLKSSSSAICLLAAFRLCFAFNVILSLHPIAYNRLKQNVISAAIPTAIQKKSSSSGHRRFIRSPPFPRQHRTNHLCKGDRFLFPNVLNNDHVCKHCNIRMKNRLFCPTTCNPCTGQSAVALTMRFQACQCLMLLFVHPLAHDTFSVAFLPFSEVQAVLPLSFPLHRPSCIGMLNEY